MPQFLTVCKIVPALLAGCCVVLKPAPESILDAQLLADIAAQADLPPGVFNVVPGERAVGESLVSHPGVDKVSFTGSTAAGRQVAVACAQGLKQVSLELGGKSAAIVLDDADPAKVAGAIQSASLANSGQVCNALSRILVPADRQDEFVEALAAGMESMTVGDPTDPATQLGPLVAERQQTRVRGYIDEGRREGARLVVGGADLPDGIDTGWYVRPTLFSNASNDMRIAREEIFGPVLSVLTFRTVDEAVEKANNTAYGLSAGVWTDKGSRILKMSTELKAGVVWANTYNKFDPTSPFGGYKESGFGREGGRQGLLDYCKLV
jgi:acyl-CoA reductase-like NAD-dependent aldehyde dehydrogenase